MLGSIDDVGDWQIEEGSMSTEDASDDSEIVLRLVPEWEKEEPRLPIPAKGVLPVDRGINIFLEIESCIDSYIETSW